MLSTARSGSIWHASRTVQILSQRLYASSAHPSSPKNTPNVSATNEVATSAAGEAEPLLEDAQKAEKLRVTQAPNRLGVWSRSQNPRPKAMTGPRFEQTIVASQPQPYAAIDLIHRQPVRWSNSRIVECDGGGGPLGHPRVFINTDKPQICMCEYCGLPFANEHHRKHLESLPADQLTYPLQSQGDAAEIPESQRITDEPLGQR